MTPIYKKYVDLFWKIGGELVEKGVVEGDFPFSKRAPVVVISHVDKSVEASYCESSHKIIVGISLSSRLLLDIQKIKGGVDNGEYGGYINKNKPLLPEFYKVFCGGPYPGTLVHELEHAWRSEEHTDSPHSGIELKIEGVKKTYDFNEAATAMYNQVLLHSKDFWKNVLE